MKSLNELKKEIADNFKEYEKTGTNPWTAKIATMDLSRQVGSLAELIMQRENDRYLKLSKEELKEKISDELADIIADTSFIAHELDIDLEQAWETMLKSDKKKIEERSED